MDKEKMKTENNHNWASCFGLRLCKKLFLLVLLTSVMYAFYVNYSHPIIYKLEKEPTPISLIIDANNSSEPTPAPVFIPKFIKTRVTFPDEPEHKIKTYPGVLFKEKPINASAVKNLKKLIYWNEFYGLKHFGLGFGQLPFLMAGCQYNNCYATGQRDLFPPEEWDALLWHFRSNDKSLPKKRDPKTKYIFFMVESPYYLFGNLGEFDNVFNVTHTYRVDSDVPARYGFVVKRKSVDKSYLSSNFHANKTNMAAWFVSHCNAGSERKTLAETLGKHFKIDIYGNCGSLQCSRKDSGSCYKMVAAKYFFYLSFENSLCQDYITEKFFNLLNYSIIPVVYGYGPYWKHAPPHSYIDVFDFPSVEHLANYLKYLKGNATAYNEYFRWKAYYRILEELPRNGVFLCKMCELMNKNETKVYQKLNHWFTTPHCKTGTDHNIVKFIKGGKFKNPFNEYTNQNMEELKVWQIK